MWGTYVTCVQCDSYGSKLGIKRGNIAEAVSEQKPRATVAILALSREIRICNFYSKSTLPKDNPNRILPRRLQIRDCKRIPDSPWDRLRFFLFALTKRN